MTSLKSGLYQVFVIAPAVGVVLDTALDMEDRKAHSAQVDDAYLQESLVALAVSSAAVIAELERRQTSNTDTTQRVPTSAGGVA